MAGVNGVTPAATSDSSTFDQEFDQAFMSVVETIGSQPIQDMIADTWSDC
jgi:hypothetical protein